MSFWAKNSGRLVCSRIRRRANRLIENCRKAALSATRTYRSKAETGRRSQSSDAVLRVLIVDDNEDAATALELLLEEAGHLVKAAHTGPAGLAAALEFLPDVMLLDIGLPELDGFEVAKRIRQQAALHDVVLVAMTGYGRENERQRSQEAGFDHHLVKPADFGTLEQILAAVSERVAQAAEQAG